MHLLPDRWVSGLTERLKGERYLPCFQPQERLLAAICRWPKSTQSANQTQWMHEHHLSSLDWSALVTRAIEERLAPLLATRLREQPHIAKWLTDAWGPCPGPLSQALQRSIRANWSISTLRQHMLSQVQHALDEEGLPFLLFKGMSYLGTLYDDPALRPMEDMDLLIHPRDLTRVTELLLAMGFSLSPEEHPCAKLFVHYDKRVYLDLHYQISWPGMTSIQTQEIFERARPQGEGTPLFPSPVDQFLLHTHHQCKHQLFPRYVPLLSFVELDALWQQVREQWPQMLEQAQRWHMAGFVESSLLCIDALYTEPLDPPLRASLLKSWATRWVRQPCSPEHEQAPDRLLARGLFLLTHLDHWSNRLGYLQRRLQHPFRAARKWGFHGTQP